MKKDDEIAAGEKLAHHLKALSTYFVATSSIIVLLVLAGWQFNIQFLKHPFSGFAPMSPISALCLLCISIAFFAFDKKNKSVPWLGYVLASFPIVVGISHFAEAYQMIKIPVNLVLYRDQLNNYKAGSGFGPIAANTALSFVLLGISLIGLQMERKIFQSVSNYSSFIVFLITLFSLIGYFYKADELYDFIAVYPMAISTAFVLMFISLAMIFYNPKESYFSILLSSNTGGVIVRVLIPAAILIPVVLGYIRLLFHWNNLLEVESGVAALVLSMILTFVLFVLFISRLINRKEILQRSAESKFRDIIESAPDAMLIVNEFGVIKIINAQTEKLFGYRRGEIIGRKVEVLIPQRFTTNHSHLREKFTSNPKTREMGVGLELYGMKKDGSEFPIEISLSPLKTEEGLLVSAAIRDITKRKKIEEENRFLASIASNIQDPVITLDTNSVIIRWNEAAEELLEWKSEEVIGKNAIEIFDIIYSHQTRPQITAAYVEKGYWRGEVIYHTKSGKPVHVIVTGSRLINAEGKITGQLLLVRDISARIKAEEKSKIFEHFFNNSNDFSCIANTEGYFEIVNPSFNRMLGYTQNELLQVPFLNFVHPDDVASTLIVYDSLKQGSNLLHFINRYRKKDGHYLWFDWSAVPDPVTGKLYCIARDFTDRKNAEDALKKLNEELEQEVKKRIREIKKNERRFQALVENNLDIVSLMDESLKVIYRSPSAQRIIGWNDSEMENMSGIINIHPDDLPYARGIVSELMSYPGKSIETLFRYQHKDGYYLWVEGTLINLLHDEDVKAIVFNYRDITKRKELEDLLNKANTLARIGGWNVDLINGTLYWTDITKEIHETSLDFVPSLEKGISFYKEGETRRIISQTVDRAIESGTPWDLELEIVTAKGNLRWVRTIGESEFVNGKCVKLYGSFQDITDRKNAEVKLEIKNRELQKANSELDRFVYSTSHDLRAPLKSLLGLIHITEKSAAPDDTGLMEKLKMMNRSVTKLDDFIEEILHYSRNARLDVAKEEIDFEKMIQEIDGNLKFINDGRGLNLKMEIDQQGKFISDTRRVSVILSNLISNAIKYQDQTKDQLNLTISIHSNYERASIEIEDNGIGIEKQSQERIFEMFYRATTLSTGSGLGLYIVKEVVEKLKGNITLVSELKIGTKVNVIIPNLLSELN